MSYIIRCYTLFDITNTGILNRSKAPADASDDWIYKRNTQCNFYTILQVISLRSQPEIILKPDQIKINFQEFQNFGFLLETDDDIEIPCWIFDFGVQHHSVFDDGITDLGGLYHSCDSVPMIKTHVSWEKLPAFLDTSIELRNIYFEII